MNLSADEVRLFFATWLPLLRWVNERSGVVPGLVVRADPGVDPADLARVRDALWADPKLLDAFVATNPAGLSAESLTLALSWKARRVGTFTVLRVLQKHAVVIADDASRTIYAVHGLSTPLDELLPWLPCMVQGVLLPFGDRIIFDGLMGTYSVHLGPGLRRGLEDTYRAGKAGIVTSLTPPAKVAKAASKKGAEKVKLQEAVGAAATKALLHPGRCEGCGGVFSKRAIGRHLTACEMTQAMPKGARPTPVHRLVVEAPGWPEYWLQLEVPKGTTLGLIDGLLRELWLECCGHLSAFEMKPLASAAKWPFALPPRAEEQDMDAKVDAFMDQKSWRYQYDFGSTTELTVRPAGTTVGRRGGVRVLARNLPPTWPCVGCGARAVQICTVCRWEDGGWLCAKCARKHACGTDSQLPVVNSPRTGVCGYTG